MLLTITTRYSWLRKYLFEAVDEVQDYATNWLWFYNKKRAHKTNSGSPLLMAALGLTINICF